MLTSNQNGVIIQLTEMVIGGTMKTKPLQNLKKYLKENKIDINDIARVLNTKYRYTVSRKLNGERKFTAIEIERLVEKFNIPRIYFFESNN